MAHTTTPDALRRLAEAHRVSTTYAGFDGQEREVPEDTLRDVLTALGADAADDAAVEAALAERELAPWRRTLPPVVVAVAGRGDRFPVHVPHGSPVRVSVVAEDGTARSAAQAESWRSPRDVDGELVGRATFEVPEDLPVGWYELRAECPDVEGGRPVTAPLAVTPARLATTDRLHSRRRWGYMAQVYSVTSGRSWGVGDLSDLAGLAAISGEQGADYLLVNPLHAAEPVPPVEPSPYLPTSRRFFNPLYLRIAEIPEYAYLRPADLEVVSTLAAIQRKANLDTSTIDRDTAYAAKLKSLELLFTVRRSPHRQQQLRRFVAEGGQGLQDFGLWCALREELGEDAPEWQDGAATPDSPYAAEARQRLARRIDFHVWMQWLLDEQLEAAQRAARLAGMDVGVIHDLAVGVHKHGSDAWTLQDVLALGVSVGAPADMYNQKGQNWSQPPWHPERLAEAGYRPWRDMLRTIFRHAGGIRVDHILGLYRLWWIPDGREASDGAYVYYDHEAMVGILALEAELAGAVVVGEDLGTLEPWVREHLAERGVLGTSILWFELDEDGEPLDPAEYRELSMASVNTHDFPPTAGFLEGVQVDVREQLGLLARPVEEERAEAARQLETFFGAVARAGLLPEGQATDEQGRVEALHRWLARSPALLLNVSLVDAVGERRMQNQPGTGDEYPNWRVPLADGEGNPVLLETLPENPRANALVRAVNEALGTHPRLQHVGEPRQPRTRDRSAPEDGPGTEGPGGPAGAGR
ncbi:4-alpha-glucanotransferase [Kocuria sp. LUK]|uniref:4-alpha-glucanotransferase n=1 Tax=Kocuria sp. LUK TaxID=2897828 RepID=UPI001E48DBA7|nr:4-alpha-glucanotransferase [Kocuria sp. LUK]MCD1145550.1 4-alpha-glucanotransferase [Kocuria sp. LUK]